MKKLILFAAIYLVSMGLLNAQEQENRYEEITNPKLLYLNKEKPRASFFSFASTGEALAAGNPVKRSNFLLLNGTWKFNYTDNFNDRPKDRFYDLD
ncbi:MAG: hypothetical protein VB068_07225, partial [Petrimonas sp.]|nr:hypothetical protein [Petrimonas sp.]